MQYKKVDYSIEEQNIVMMYVHMINSAQDFIF